MLTVLTSGSRTLAVWGAGLGQATYGRYTDQELRNKSLWLVLEWQFRRDVKVRKQENGVLGSKLDFLQVVMDAVDDLS